MNAVTKLALNFSHQSRIKRAHLFRNLFRIHSNTKLLDLGLENGVNINSVLQNTRIKPENVFIADIDQVSLANGNRKFGFTTVLLNESGKLPIEDNFFDVVYCSSVIEHATVTKDKIWDLSSVQNFGEMVWEKQNLFASEINRVGRGFFVQTPNISFPIESHSWLPLVGQLPRYWQVRLFKITNKFWIKRTIPDFHLLGRKQMAELFPEAEIISEMKFGLVKSIIAVKKV